jgi:hypothetical protein
MNLTKERRMIDSLRNRAASPTAAPRRFAPARQDCGPTAHFSAQERAGALQEIWRCSRCGHVNQPFSEQQATLMRQRVGSSRLGSAFTREVRAAA